MKSTAISTAVLLLLVWGIPVGHILAQSPLDPSSTGTCSNSAITESVQAAIASISQSQARQVAAPGLAAHDSGNSYSFNSIFEQLGYTSTCSVFLENVNVVYDLKGQSGDYTLEVTLNPSLTTVTSITEYNSTYAGTVLSSPNWTGPEYHSSSGVASAGASWSEPSVSQASGSQCSFAHCDYVFWVGNTAAAAGGSGGSAAIAQTGTDSGIYCTIGCSYYYYDWYEFFPSAEVKCNNISVGDSITASVGGTYNSQISGYEYETVITDNTSDQVCDGNSGDVTPFMGESYYAQFMGERPTMGGSYTHLPDFSTLSESGGYYYDGGNTEHTIGGSWTNGYVMELTSTQTSCDGNLEYYNICPSGVSSGSFTETFDSAGGT
jgi:hypothetical protein